MRLVIGDQLPRQSAPQVACIIMRLPPIPRDKPPHFVMQQHAFAGFVFDERERLQFLQQDAPTLFERQIGQRVKHGGRHAAIRDGEICDGVFLVRLQCGNPVNQGAFEQFALFRRRPFADCAGTLFDFREQVGGRQRAQRVIHPVREQRQQHGTPVRKAMKCLQRLKRTDAFRQRFV